jgi:hypothetical protein
LLDRAVKGMGGHSDYGGIAEGYSRVQARGERLVERRRAATGD